MIDSSALTVEKLTFRYREREEPSLKDISFQVASGELLLLAGASGSGKTTLIRCINGYSPVVAIVGEFLPAAGPNLIFAAILVPVLVLSYTAVQRQTGR